MAAHENGATLNQMQAIENRQKQDYQTKILAQ